ncbi:hypothetical protein BESB_058820 [Besnoitia besnoiti]|uniref:Uncharacterized protein n=1 Tax=Besnoitia besnoiti TaxID=94643 RepID=A0A2A9MAH9_BESBE|nr:hypothetical protein BESB_058820 [Besnoitia besnoiti]PFH34995.1 hypothetical protein BESB_058820 [Besnoitia besnoiti]
MGRVSNWEMELLAQKFPIRGEILGEDRYLNRYFLVPTARGVPRIFVEAFAHTQIDPVEAIDGFVDHVAAAAMEQEERKKEKEEDDGAASTLAESAPAGGIPTSNASCPPPSSLSALSSSSQVPNGLDAGAGMPGGGAGAPVPVGLLPGDRVGERRSSRRIAQRHQLELLHEASSSGTPLAGSVLNGLGAGFARAEERKRKRGSLTGEGKKFGLVAPTAAMKSSVLSALLGSAFVEGASGVKKLQAQEGEKAKHVNDFVRRAVDFSSISTYLQYLEETLKACGLFVVPPGRPLQQLQQALSPYLTRERALKEKLRRVDQQFQQLAASCPLPTPPRVFIPPSLFAACIWHGCRLLLQLEEALLLPLFASSWGFASVFQKQQHVLRLFHESQDRVASKRSSPSASLSQSRGERSDGRRAVLLSEDEGSGASSCGRSREKEREEGKRTEDEKESGEESGWRRRASDAKRRGGKDEEDDTCDALKEQDELAQKLQTRVWPQDVLHKCLSALAAHANVMGGEKKKKPEEPKASMKREEEEKEVKLKVEDTLAAGGLASREENAKTEKADHEETVREEQREAEEQEAQWMERRICLVVFAQLLLYIEKRLHTLSNVHTATWHIQQHHQWRREVTALGGAAALAQLALPLPSFEFSASPPAGAKSEGEEKVQCRGAKKGARGGSARKAATSEESRRERGGTRKGREEDADEQEKADEGGESDDEEGEETQDEGEEDGEKPSLDWQSRDGEDDPEKAHDDKDADDETRAEGGGLPPSPSLSPPAKADEFMPAATPESSAPEAEPASSAAAAVSLAASSSESCALPPDSPLQRILALIDAIGWDRDPTFSYLRTLRQSELEEMRRTREEEEKPRWAALLERGEMDGAQGGASASSSFVPEGEEDPLLSWTRVRNRHDVLAVWGFYLNIWKAFGLERQKVIDARTTVDRNTFLSLLAHDEQRAHLPDVGTRLFYFRRGHEQMMTAIQQEYGDTVEGRRWVDSTSMPLSIPYELGRVEELIVDSISYHPGIVSPLPPRAAPALSASCLSSSLLSGLGGSEAETGSSLPEKLYSFSIVDDPYALGLLVGDASRTKARSVPSQGGRRDASGPASLGSTPAASAAPTAGSPPASLCTSSAPTTADLLLSSRLPHAELGHAENDVSLPAAAATLNSLPCASTPGHVSSAVRTPGADPTSAGAGGEMDGSVTPSDPLLSGERKTLPAGVLGQTEFEMLSAADPVASACQEAERARQLLLQTREGKARDDAGEQDAKVHLETAPYYRMVCRVLRRFHETTADNISDRVKSIVAAAAAANEEKPHTRTSSRLLSYQNRSLSSRSPLALRSSSSSERRLQSSRQRSQGGDEEGHAAPEGAIQFPHASGPLDEREVVLCVPLRADDVEFVVKREKVFNALNLCWNPGMKFRMLFHTAVSAASDSAACTKDRETAGAAAASGKDNGAAAAGGGTAAAAGTANHNAGAGAGSASGDRAAGTGGDKSSLSTTTRYTGTIRRVDLLHPDFWENVLVEWEDRSRAGGVATAAGSGVGGASRGSSGDKGERGSGQKSDADSGFENVSLWELEPLKRLKRPGGSNTGD